MDVTKTSSSNCLFNFIGRCKSALHTFLENILDKVRSKVEENEKGRKIIFILPHCTWEKFGDILANSGGKVMGLFDKFISFFSTMNMYSASKTQVQDNREYQDFLQMFTGKEKNRETGTAKIHYIGI